MFNPQAIEQLMTVFAKLDKFMPILELIFENLPPIDVKPITLTDKDGKKKDYIAILFEKPKDKLKPQ
jgi:hypothetical protein